MPDHRTPGTPAPKRAATRTPSAAKPSGHSHRSPAPLKSHRKTVLVAVTGLSPAVLTETVWALARENPPVIPDTVIVVTTATGKNEITRQLFGADDIWGQLRATLLGPRHAEDERLSFDDTPDRVKVVHIRDGARRKPLDQLTTLAHNKAFADYLVDELWVHTKPGTRVVASLAGGFKTMSALLLSAMQLLANPGDRVTHVLVDGGFDATKPGFFFPEQTVQELAGKFPPFAPLFAAKAAPLLTLIDVPVIPLRRWFEDALAVKPPSYDVLLTASIRALEEAIGDIALTVGPVAIPRAEKKHHIVLNGQRCELSLDRFAYIRFFAEHLISGEPDFPKAVHCVEKLKEWLAQAKLREPRLFNMAEALDKNYGSEELSRRLFDLRNYFAASKIVGGRSLASAMPIDGRWTMSLDPSRVTLL